MSLMWHFSFLGGEVNTRRPSNSSCGLGSVSTMLEDSNLLSSTPLSGKPTSPGSVKNQGLPRMVDEELVLARLDWKVEPPGGQPEVQIPQWCLRRTRRAKELGTVQMSTQMKVKQRLAYLEERAETVGQCEGIPLVVKVNYLKWKNDTSSLR